MELTGFPWADDRDQSEVLEEAVVTGSFSQDAVKEEPEEPSGTLEESEDRPAVVSTRVVWEQFGMYLQGRS